MSKISPDGPEPIDFFISRRGSGKEIAMEVARVLDGAGKTLRIQDRDIKPGDDYYKKMGQFLRECRDFVAILTRDYFEDDGYAKDEWYNFKALARDSGGRRRLIPLLFDDFQPGDIDRTTKYVSLVGVTSKAKRRKIVLDAIAGIESSEPIPPAVSARAASPQPKFPIDFPARNAAFVGRADLLEQLDQTLRQSTVARVAIQGLGGVGKTSFAVEYAYRHAEEYEGIWWAPAETRAMLVDSLARLDTVLDGKDPDAAPPARHPEQHARQALVKLASRARPWLLIYDNVDKPISEFYPASGARLLITTRRTNVNQTLVPFPLKPMEKLEASRMLQSMTGRRDSAGAVRLAMALGNLPLALDHAVAYMHGSDVSFDEYVERLDKLIARGRTREDKNSVASTFTLAIERAAEDCPAALKLLSFLSMLSSEQIPRNLVDDSIVPDDDRDDAMAALASASLIRYEELDDGSRGISVHRLVQAAMQRHLGSEGAAEALAEAIARLSKAYPNKSLTDTSTWRRCQHLLPHALVLREKAQKTKFESEDLALLLNGAGNFQNGRSAFVPAETLLKECVAMAERVLGPEHKQVGAWLADLGNLYLNSARYPLAREKYERAISIGVQTLGRDSPVVARRMSNLGYAAMKLRRFKQAEGYYKEALITFGYSNGIRDYSVATTLHKLGYLLWETKRYGPAERRFRAAIEIGTEVNTDKVRIYDWQADLAHVLRDSGRLEEAERLYREAIDGLDGAAVGDDHPSASFARREYALLLWRAGRRDEASAMARRALDVQTKLFGADHKFALETAETLNCIIAGPADIEEPARLPAKRPAKRRLAEAS